MPESKIVKPKDPSLGQQVKVKEGSKTFFGTVEAVGNKSDIEKRLTELESAMPEEEDGKEFQTEPGTCTNNIIIMLCRTAN